MTYNSFLVQISALYLTFSMSYDFFNFYPLILGRSVERKKLKIEQFLNDL